MGRACLLLVVSTLSLACVSPALGADDDGWIVMFDGTSLDGWKASGEPVEWVIEDGAIRTPPGRSHLYYVAKELKNFEFVGEVKTTPGSNSGIFFHTRYQADGWPEHGYESQVNQSHTDPVRSGSLYNVVKLYDTPAEDNQWYEHRIRVQGNNIRVHVNGKLVIDYTEPRGVTEKRRLSQGVIALQGHDPNSVVYYRNLRVRPLPE